MGPNLKIRNTSRIDLTMDELMAAPGSETENSFGNLSKKLGTIDVLYYPFNDENVAWVKSWTVIPEKPANSREVTEPYALMEGSPDIPTFVADLLAANQRNNPAKNVPPYSQQSVEGVAKIIANNDPETKFNDIWGSAYTTTMYVKPMTPRNTVAAWGVIVARENMQRALSEFYAYFRSLIQSFADRGLYPYAGPVELRAHGLDHSEEVLIPNAVEPTLSGARPLPGQPDKDTIIWYAINNTVDLPHASEFNAELEKWFLTNYQSYGVVRPEWTKAYAYTADGAKGGAWTNDEILQSTFPDTWRNGYARDNNWDSAVKQLNSLDPNRVFTNDFLDKLFPA